MKRMILAVTALSVAGLCFAADPAEGFWAAPPEKGGEAQAVWEFYQNNGILYGTLVSGAGLTVYDKAVNCKEGYRDFPIAGKVYQLPVLGTPWIFGLRSESPARWNNGYVINPADGTVYKCKITYHPAEALEVRGEIGLGVGGSRYWKRLTQE
ncbi:MAG: DUF2147 domain-containing protein [Treponema sp.]|jgi:uncharacterized protein (DUF2147 family)|nr:DUF2147 domain-containing protein [Treponema sp.]